MSRSQRLESAAAKYATNLSTITTPMPLVVERLAQDQVRSTAKPTASTAHALASAMNVMPKFCRSVLSSVYCTLRPAYTHAYMRVYSHIYIDIYINAYMHTLHEHTVLYTCTV